ncbi:MAG: GatB/YqeY domain-containing protein [bacterium]
MLLDKIESDLKEAMKSKDSLKVETLRMLKSALNYYKIEKKLEEFKDEDVLTILSRQVKQHKESIEGFEKGNRQDLIEQEKKELAILETYMPTQASAEEVAKVVSEVIKEVGATGKKDFGKIMKPVMEKLKGKVDGKVISQKVGEELAKLEKSE